MRSDSTSRAKIARQTIRVLLLERNLLAEELLAGRGVASTSLGVDGLTLVLAEPCGERGPCVVDVVGDTLRVSSTVDTYELKKSS